RASLARSRSGGSPQIPGPVIRIAPKPSRFTVRSPPTSILPAAAAVGLPFMACSFPAGCPVFSAAGWGTSVLLGVLSPPVARPARSPPWLGDGQAPSLHDRYLVDNGIRVVKVLLNLSKREQAK